MTSPFINDLNDFISPSQACIKPVPSKSETVSVSLDTGNDIMTSDPVTISLNDCLACSGCITSAESVLVSQQTYLQLYSVLDTNIEALKAGISKPKVVIVSVSPQSRTALAARFNMSLELVTGKICAFLKGLGVDFVFDTNFGRDISLHECALEFVDYYRQSQGLSEPKLPLICGACPGWICYAEKTQPQLVEHLSRVKSPQQIMGTLAKYFFAPRVLSQNISPAHVYHVTVMPCYDKKLEASRPDFFDETFQTRDVDCVISTSELMKMVEEKCGVESFLTLLPLPMSELSFLDNTTGAFFNHGGSGSGGYLEHVFIYSAKMIYNVEIGFNFRGEMILSPDAELKYQLVIETQRNSDYQDISLIDLQTSTPLLKFAKVYGFRNVQNLVRKVKNRKVHYDYVEVMACPGACLNGGGQLRPEPSSGITPKQNLDNMQRIYVEEQKLLMPLVDQRVELAYREWLGGYGSPLLRTTFRAVEKTLPTSNISVQWLGFMVGVDHYCFKAHSTPANPISFEFIMEKWGIKFGKMVPKVKPADLLKTWKIVKGDLVEVISGAYKGQRGKVLRVQRDRNGLIVEGINLVKRHVSSQLTGGEKGSIITMEQPISVSNVALIDPLKKEPTKVKWGWIEETARGIIRKARISKLSNVEIPKPEAPKRIRKTGSLDTQPEVVLKQTFFPSLTVSPIPKDCQL